MTSFFQTAPSRGPDAADGAPAVAVNPWMVVLGSLAGVLLLGGGITVAVGLGIVGQYGQTVLGQFQPFDEGVTAAIVGGAAVVLGILVGAAWLVLGVLRSDRRR